MSTENEKKLLVVIGATGVQGGSVVSTFLSEALVAKGVEMVQADLDDPSSLHSAFSGATAIFAITDFWAPFFDPESRKKVKPSQSLNEWAYEKELAQAKAIIDAAAKVDVDEGGLQRLIWSGLSAAKKWSKGKYTWVYHFDSKADATEYIEKEQPELWKKTSVIQVGGYASNHMGSSFSAPRKVSSLDSIAATGVEVDADIAVNRYPRACMN